MALVTANGIEIEYEAFGDRDHPCLLLVMGFNMPLNAWPEPFCRRLAGAGYWVVRFDNRDVGMSSRLDHLGRPRIVPVALKRLCGLIPRTPYTLDDMAADTLGLLDALGVARCHLVGISMGGMIAQLLATAHPERLLSLGLLMTSRGARRHLFPSPRLLPLAWRQPGPDLASQLRYGLAFWRAVAGAHYPPDDAVVKAQIEDAARRTRGPHGRERQLAALIAAPDRRRALERVRLPVTVVHGTADPLIPAAAGAAVARAIPGAHLELIEGLGHYLPEALWPRLIGALLENCARA